MSNIYLSEDTTQITLSCIANMIRNGDYNILKEFVDERNFKVRSNIYMIAVELNSDLVHIMKRDGWNVLFGPGHNNDDSW